MRHSVRAWLALAGVILLNTGCADAPSGSAAANTRHPAVVGLATSLPIVWPESASMSELLNRDTPPHWALGVLRESGKVRPLDNLALESNESSESGQNPARFPISAENWLILAQPYPLAPQENVALDDWVRAGGRVLLFADPMLTQESVFPLGDRRRPQDVVLLSPILMRWGLELRFDDGQARGERDVQFDGGRIPVNLPGSFAVLDGGASNCRLAAQGLVAKCRIGRGRLVAVADAALLEDVPADAVDARKSALRSLMGVLGSE